MNKQQSTSLDKMNAADDVFDNIRDYRPAFCGWKREGKVVNCQQRSKIISLLSVHYHGQAII